MTNESKVIKTPEGQPDKIEVKAQIKNGKMRGRNVMVLMDADDVVKEQVTGFVDFLREHAVVGLAIGFIVGQQAQGVIKQLVSSFIDPMFQFIFGKKLSERTMTWDLGSHHATFGWGGLIYALLNLFFVLVTIYILIKLFKLDKLDKPEKA